MNNDLDVNILVQTFNERMAQMMTEIVIKEATIKQLTAQIEQLTAQQKTVKTTKTKTEDFEWGKWNVKWNNWNNWSNWARRK